LGLLLVSCKQMKRTVLPEEIAMEIEYMGTCENFITNDLPTVRTSIHLDGNCLPISTTSPHNDLDELHIDYHCTNTHHGRSNIKFVEIYATHGTLYPNNIVSFVPSFPFRAKSAGSEVNYVRRPSCGQDENYCKKGCFRVTSCQDNEVSFKRGYVVNQDRIYLLASTRSARTCKALDNSCCAYIAITTGICPVTAPTELLDLDDNHHGHNNHHGHDDHDDDNDHGHNNHHGNNNHHGHDDHDDDNDHGHNNHHGHDDHDDHPHGHHNKEEATEKKVPTPSANKVEESNEEDEKKK